MFNGDVISMPDKWEYPWYAAWDLAFHTVALVAGRLRLRQGAAAADAAQPLQPPERPDSGLRVELQRRQPAGARLGDAVPLQGRARPRPRGHRVPRALVPGPDAQLQLVGEPQGSAGPQRVRRRLPRPRQHRRVRPQRAAADRRIARAGRRHRVDGVLLPEHARDRADPGRARPAVRGRTRSSSCSTSCGSPTRWTASATTTTRCGTRRTASSTTCCACPTARRRA